ncbi:MULTISPECIES: hypothetical protein [Priestia]|uniref:hypothetical protein n=1 Tax=Priestia TaxID=2800373 RepID=UPI00159B9B6A|nr:hypothetical protein [Priestia megaterium]MDP9580255.1 hypothetical protein [Bacillus sp. 1751]MEB2278249.1 hypothetical protein [Bacillus sp. ILBB4]MBQ4870761.1 hypothetical protein [Priestia megaterium]MDH2449358.1 hypothetical protein [Priestia megaterium]MDL5148816.1 hypothetical protein [Priestia megaterium]
MEEVNIGFLTIKVIVGFATIFFIKKFIYLLLYIKEINFILLNRINLLKTTFKLSTLKE